MSHAYKAVGWNRQKRIYDRILVGGVLGYLGLFVALTLAAKPHATVETALIRAFGTAALLLLHLALAIGPLARLDRRFLPLLYNRRHLGVVTFLLGLAHGGFALVQFHALGDLPPLVSVLVSNTRFASLAHFPFQQLGLAALVILFLMAATSHDFWLANLSAPVWKALHMGVYFAYGLLVAHVALGVLQAETSPLLAGALGLGLVTLTGVHLVAGWRERRGDGECPRTPEADGFVEVCRLGEIPENRARIATLGGERVAVFRWDGKLSAVSNVCRHQNGPLGEGRVIDGCITCPWHGYQYRPETGASPPPFTEKVPTYRVRLVADRVLLHPQALPPETFVEPAVLGTGGPAPATEPGDFYVGYQKTAPAGTAGFVRRLVAALLAGAGALAVLLAMAQQPFADASFEYGTVRTFTGVLEERPYPTLGVRAPGEVPRRSLLVVPGKFGAAELVAGLDGVAVSLQGRRIRRGGVTMVEVVPGSLQRGAASAGEAGAEVSLGRASLDGEIVDSKCWLGVMNPGEGKPHRDCAVRCLSGGAPPALIVRRGQHAGRVVLLTRADGGPLGREILPFVAEPVRVAGELRRRGESLLLRIEGGIERR
ncbi:MAG TPA: Rieske 2Fe-2S domain-containing protein [Thermoanaerobaculia bacterium]|nr:Rieske 2Fe-2S domain-containing protein [Thermoanaerobaculia bacterium]